MRKSGIGSHAHARRGRSNDWLTPLSIIKELGAFDLDPCGYKGHRTAKRIIYPPRDGLSMPWHGRVWLNPPYGPDTGVWLSRLAQHRFGTALIFARTETKAFHNYVWCRARSVFFFEGRIKFLRPGVEKTFSNAGGPSCLVAYGPLDDQNLALAGCTLPGKFIRL